MNRLLTLSKLLVLFFLLLAPLGALQAQDLQLQMSNYESGGGDSIRVDITLDSFDNTYSFQYTTLWDTSELTYLGVGNFNMPELDENSFGYVGVDDGFLITLWADLNVVGYDVEDGTVIYSIYFTTPCGGNGVDTAAVEFFNMPIPILASTLNEEFAPPTENGSVIFVELEASSSTVVDVSCNGSSDGCITMNPTGGTPPFNYAWSNGGTGQELCGLAPGSYTCTVTDAGDCTAVSSSITVGEPTIFNICNVATTDATCNGGNDACIDINPCGGTAPYTFLWMPGGMTDEDPCGLAAGNYTCLLTDGNGCTVSSGNINVGEPDAIVLTSSNIINANCTQGGSIDITLDGGVGSYTYLWTNGDTTEDINDLVAGFYTCDVTDSNACMITTAVLEVVLENSDLELTGSTTDNVSCLNGSDGSIDLDVSGTATPLMYLWSNGDISQDITGLDADTYTCTITDAMGCVITTPVFEITEPATALVVNNLEVIDLNCFGEANGCVTITMMGGNSPYTYLWTNGETTQEICNLSAGDYTCTVTDAGTCSLVSAVATVEQPALLEVCGNVVTDVSCFGGNDACISLTTCGGLAPYTYLWSNGATDEDICDLIAGVYTCTITDGNGCTTSIVDVEVDEPTAIMLTNVIIVNASCAQGGSIDVTLGGGNDPYTYLWSNGDTTEDINDLVAGLYTCDVMDADGCMFTTLVQEVILENSDLELTGSNIANVSCLNGSDGSIDLDISGTATPLMYLWSNGDITQDISGLDADTYTCIITDANGCVITTPVFEITEPATALIVDNLEVIGLNCFGETNGCVTINMIGGNPPYSYLWSNGGTTQEICNLPAGDYTCTITDAGACSLVSVVATIEQPALLEVCGNVVTDVFCFGGDDACISLTTCGGLAPYTYLWGNGATDEDICGLIAGMYSCTITDANACTTTIIDVEVNEPPSILLTNATVVNATCAQGGSIDISLSGGNEPYTYLWSNGDTTEDISDLVAGFYTCAVTDSDACVFTTAVIEVILENSDLSFTEATVVDVQCFGESNGGINIQVAGTATPLSFLWTNGEVTQNIDELLAGTYVCTITDANACVVSSPVIVVGGPASVLQVVAANVTDVSCFGENDGIIELIMAGGTIPYSYNWSNGGAMATIDNLSPGFYTCTITDVNNCTEETVAYEIVQPTAIGLTSSQVVDASCMAGGGSGSIDINVGGGSGPYTYLWSNAAVVEDIDGLFAGIYTCTITDDSMCSFVTQTFVVEEDGGDLVLESTNSTDVNCIGGSDGTITLSVTGTATPITYLWDTGAVSQNLSNLSSGTYVCTITDGNTCSVVTQVITINEPTTGLAISNIAGVNASCSDSNDGSISLSLSGGTTPYTYDWSNDETTEDIMGLESGNYSCVIADANGCSVESSIITITAPDVLVIDLVGSSNASCGQGGNNGSIDIDVNGGTPIYTYLWSNGATTQDITSIPSGVYTCTVTDLEACTQVSGSYTIENLGSNLMYNGAIVNDVFCFDENNGSVDIDVSGTATPLTYEWSNSAMTEDIDGLSGGNYSCTITNANGCTAVTPVFTITEPDMALGANAISVFNTCAGTANGSISIEGIGGTAPYVYLWSNGEETAAIVDLVEGLYTCTIMDANGCEFTTSEINVENIDSDLVVNSEEIGQISCFGLDNGFVNLDVTGTALPIIFAWSNAAVTEDIDNLTAGNYTCTVSDGNGCVIVTNTFTISESPTALAVSLVSLTDASCGQGGAGSIDIDVTGGLTTYSYLWSNGAITQDLIGIPAGIYNCVITDVNGCTLTTPNYDVINQGSDLTLNATTDGNVSCFDGNNGFVNLDVTGTSTPITFEWSNGEMTQNINGLEAGTYTCTITDNSGCTAVTPNIEIIQPEAALFADTDQIANACTGADNGSISILVTGGTEPYTYLWSNGAMTTSISDLASGMYSCVVTDDQGCIVETEMYEIISVESDLNLDVSLLTPISCFGENNGMIDIEPTGTATPFTYLWSNGAETQDLGDLFAGVYSCLITDANGCVYQTEDFLMETPDVLDVCSVDIQQPLCSGVADGCIDLTACGGTAPISYLWSNGSILANPCGLEAGVYNCTITDGNGCETISPAYELEPTADPMTMDASSLTNAICGQGTGGTIDVTIGGGVPPYTYLWNNGDLIEDPIDLIAGTYNCTVTDDQGCVFVTQSFQIMNDGSDLMLTAIAATDVLCFGEATGAIDISVNGSQDPITFEWSNSEETEDIDGLIAGTYSCTVTDNVGCSIVVLEVEITEPASVLEVGQLSGQNPICFGSNDGSIFLDVLGGVMPYTFLWSDGLMVQNRDGLTSGDFVCTITDGNGCELVTDIVTIDEPTDLNLSNTEIMNELGGGSNGSVSIEVSGGQEPYTYLWDDPAMSTGPILSDVPAGDYTCVVTDGNGCTKSFGVFIVQNTDGINELEHAGFEVYPNPFVSQFTIVLEEMALNIQLIDVAGRVLYQDVSPGVALVKQVEVELTAGIYALKVLMTDGRIGVLKVVVR